jgi:hypothetical protein
MSNAKVLLLMRPRLPAPDPTQTSYSWAKAIKNLLESNGWRVIDLAENDAVRTNVENLLKTGESTVLLFYGHGLPDEMTGQEETALIDLANIHLLRDLRVYVVACWTAKVLGKASDKIARFYLGYKDKIFVWSQPYAKYLERCVNKGIVIMLDKPDCTIGEARQQIIDEYTRWIDHFVVGPGASGLYSQLFASDLRSNRDALAQVFGDETATLTD